jgi:endonuclease YncB( thermonuclease family)
LILQGLTKKSNFGRVAKIQKNRKMSKKEVQKITLNNYTQLLSKVQARVKKTQATVAEIVTRQKVEMAWWVGKLLEEHLSQNQQAGYGKHLFARLEKDSGIAQSSLYKMQRFYRAYPKLPKDDSKLNWSHYRVLSGVSQAKERKRFENFARENSWDSDTLQSEVQKSKIAQIHDGAASKRKVAPKKESEKKLYPRRGQLFSYNLVKFDGDKNFQIDCGFNIFREVEEALPAGDVQVVATTKKGKNYSLKKSTVPVHKLHTYKARLDRVVDGDTLYVILDLGFKTSHREKLRLRGIDAPELNTVEGAKSSAALKRILKNVPFLVVKTSAVDVYGRYVCDIFLAEKDKENDPQKVADEGKFLNQILLDKKLVLPFSAQ